MFGFTSGIIEVLLVILFLVLLKVYLKVTCGKTNTKVCLSGKTALITGANVGIGYATALDFAMRGAKVILACRNRDLAEKARDEIIKETNNQDVIVKIVDFSSLQSVRDFAADVNRTVDRLHILVNNAGVGSIGNEYTDDNLHKIMQINHFGPFLMTHLLTDLLKRSAPSRIIFVASKESFQNNLTSENLNYAPNSEIMFEGYKAYANSKLCNIIAADGFARILKGTGVTSNSLHPGVANSLIFQRSKAINFLKIPIGPILHFAVSIYGKTVEEGAQTTIHCAVSNEVSEITGEYWTDCKLHKKPKKANDQRFVTKIWEQSEQFAKITATERLKYD